MQELELRIETQKQTLQARDESIKKLLEMLQNKGMGKRKSTFGSILKRDLGKIFTAGITFFKRMAAQFAS
jgi:RIM-binding protein of the cytomatrix active zone